MHDAIASDAGQKNVLKLHLKSHAASSLPPSLLLRITPTICNFKFRFKLFCIPQRILNHETHDVHVLDNGCVEILVVRLSSVLDIRRKSFGMIPNSLSVKSVTTTFPLFLRFDLSLCQLILVTLWIGWPHHKKVCKPF